MDESGTGRVGFGTDARPASYDRIMEPELFEGVPARRVLAFVIDMTIIGIPVVLAAMLIFLFGLVTFGLGWMLFWLFGPGAVMWAVLYYGMTMGGPSSATLGMRTVGLEIRTWYGAPCYFLLGAVYPILFWVLTSALTPLVLLGAFFNERRQLLHDMLLGTVVINNEQRAAALVRRGWRGTSSRL